MLHVTLTGADLADLAAGYCFNAMAEDGSELLIDGEEFDEQEIATLTAGKEVEYEGYLLSCDGQAWAAHR